MEPIEVSNLYQITAEATRLSKGIQSNGYVGKGVRLVAALVLLRNATM